MPSPKLSARIERVIEQIPPLDEAAMAAARARQDSLTKPRGSLGRLEELSITLAGITASPAPELSHKAIVTMAADHGVAASGVSAYPQAVTAQMVRNFIAGGAAISVLAGHIGARVIVVDMGVAADVDVPAGAPLVVRKVAYGTADISHGPAMSAEQAVEAIEAGIDVLAAEAAKGLQMVATGDMGIANTTPSSAIAAAITGRSPCEVTGRGTGIDDAALEHKIAVVQRALEVNRPDRSDGLDVLAKVGGFEIGGLAGVTIAAAARRIPVVIDGFISGAAALIATTLAPAARHYLIASHLSAESGHRIVLDSLGCEPLLRLDMRLGEGTGAALAMSIVEAAAKILTQMASFAEAGVSGPGELDD